MSAPTPNPVPTYSHQSPSPGGRTPPRGRFSNTNAPTQLHQSSGVPHGHVPAYLPGSASLVEELDKRVLVVLRDGKHLIGHLCSYDQYSNLVLEHAIERRIVVNAETGLTAYNDIPVGIYIVRGDTVVLMGAMIEGVESSMRNVSGEELEKLAESAMNPLNWDFDTDLIA